MRLTSMTIKNFKGIDEHGVRIDFAPITLLFGPNNAGKSTVIQALHLAREVLCRNNADVDYVDDGGKAINLGGFKNYVHLHDTSRKILLRLDMEVDELPEYPTWNVIDELQFDLDFIEILSKVSTVGVEISLSYNSISGCAEFDCYTVFINNKLFTNLHINQTQEFVHFDGCICYELIDPLIQIDIFGRLKALIENERREQREILELQTELDNNIPKLLSPIHKVEFQQNDEKYTFGFRRRMPLDWYSSITTSIYDLDMFNVNFGYVGDEEFARRQSSLLSSLVLGPGRLAVEILEKLLYIGPIRVTPARNFQAVSSPDSSRWADGLAAWDALATQPDSQVAAINQHLHGEDSLQTGYTVRRKRLLALDVESPLVPALRKLVMDDINDGALPLLRDFLAQAPETRLMLRNEATGVEIEPHDMGVGISQVMPVVVAATTAKRGALVAIEQPELHIHPAWQTALGDVFIKAITGQDTPPMFLLETHSEHLMLRLLRRIRHTHAGTALESVRLSNTDLAVHWIGSYEGRTEAYRLGIDEDGSFNTPWPEGFFDERGEELFG